MRSPGPNRPDHEKKPLELAFQSLQNIVQVLSCIPRQLVPYTEPDNTQIDAILRDGRVRNGRFSADLDFIRLPYHA
jgi:hypothetical protein